MFLEFALKHLDKQWQCIPILLPGEFHSERGLVSYCPWNHKEPDKTGHVRAHTHIHPHTRTHILSFLEQWSMHIEQKEDHFFFDCFILSLVFCNSWS